MANLTTLQRRVSKLQAEIEKAESKQRAKLLKLPQKYGFKSIEAVISALQALSKRKRGRPAKSAKAGVAKKRTRTAITDAIRADVKKLAQEGKTGAEIAKAVGISLPSVQNIKKAAGLVKARK